MRNRHFVRSACRALVLVAWLTWLPPVSVVLAHAGQPVAPHDLWQAWNTDPFLLFNLALVIVLYASGVHRVWKRAGRGHGINAQNCAAFGGAMLALFVALVSPLDALSGVLFSAHMLQHMILILVAAPLFALSNGSLAGLWTLPHGWSQALGRGWHSVGRHIGHHMRKPFAAWLFFGVMLWLWHAPAFYEAALRNDLIHAAEHVGFLLSAIAFWSVLVDKSRASFLRYGMAIPLLFTTALHSSILGALMTFASAPWYSFYASSAPIWGLSPIQDQQLAGLIMWIPGGGVLTLLTVLYFGAWLKALEKRSMQREARAFPKDGSYARTR